MGIKDRLRKLGDHFRDGGPSLEEVSASFARIAGYARAKLRGEDVDGDQRDRDTVDGWARAEGADLESEAQRAKQKLRDVGRRQQ